MLFRSRKTLDYLKYVVNTEDDSDEQVLSTLGCIVLSCKVFLLLSVLFLLQVASIFKSSGAKSPAEELPRIQEATKQSSN